MGHEVFLAPYSIKLGTAWERKLYEGLEKANVLLVFWTKQAKRSDWVRTEYETFLARYPDRPLVPIRGDETELPALLKARQGLEFAPLINELLELQRDLRKHGVKREIIQEKILERLKEAGIDVNPKDRRRVFAFAGAGWLAGFSMASTVSSTLSTALEAAATLTLPQAATVGGAVVVGWLGCGLLGLDQGTNFGPLDLPIKPNGEDIRKGPQIGFYIEDSSRVDNCGEDCYEHTHRFSTTIEGKKIEWEGKMRHTCSRCWYDTNGSGDCPPVSCGDLKRGEKIQCEATTVFGRQTITLPPEPIEEYRRAFCG